MEDDPFVQTYNALWDLAENSQQLTDLVKPANRIKFNQSGPPNRHPIKTQVSQADLPELVLVSTGLEASMHSTSSSSSCIRRFEWIISTGDMVIVDKLLPVEWAIFAAMAAWKTTVSVLTWNGLSFNKRMDITSVDNGLTDPSRNRGVQGWSALWRCEIEMHFATRDLITAADLLTTTTDEATTTAAP